MKFIEKASLTIFSIIILILSLMLILMLYSWLSINNVYYALQYITSQSTAIGVTLGVSIVLILLAIKCICFPSYADEKNSKSEGILLENEAGKLLISVETLENLAKGVINGFANIKNSNCKVKLDKQINNIHIDLNLVVTPDTIIKELSVNLQDKIKEIIKATTEIEVKEINIKIKNIEASKE